MNEQSSTIWENLNAYFDGELDREQKLEMEQLLFEDPAYAAALVQWREIRRQFQTLPVSNSKPQLTKSIMSKVEEELNSGNLPWKPTETVLGQDPLFHNKKPSSNSTPSSTADSEPGSVTPSSLSKDDIRTWTPDQRLKRYRQQGIALSAAVAMLLFIVVYSNIGHIWDIPGPAALDFSAESAAPKNVGKTETKKGESEDLLAKSDTMQDSNDRASAMKKPAGRNEKKGGTQFRSPDLDVMAQTQTSDIEAFAGKGGTVNSFSTQKSGDIVSKGIDPRINTQSLAANSAGGMKKGSRKSPIESQSISGRNSIGNDKSRGGERDRGRMGVRGLQSGQGEMEMARSANSGEALKMKTTDNGNNIGFQQDPAFGGVIGGADKLNNSPNVAQVMQNNSPFQGGLASKDLHNANFLYAQVNAPKTKKFSKALSTNLFDNGWKSKEINSKIQSVVYSNSSTKEDRSVVLVGTMNSVTKVLSFLNDNSNGINRFETTDCPPFWYQSSQLQNIIAKRSNQIFYLGDSMRSLRKAQNELNQASLINGLSSDALNQRGKNLASNGRIDIKSVPKISESQRSRLMATNQMPRQNLDVYHSATNAEDLVNRGIANNAAVQNLSLPTPPDEFNGMISSADRGISGGGFGGGSGTQIAGQMKKNAEEEKNLNAIERSKRKSMSKGHSAKNSTPDKKNAERGMESALAQSQNKGQSTTGQVTRSQVAAEPGRQQSPLPRGANRFFNQQMFRNRFLNPKSDSSTMVWLVLEFAKEAPTLKK